MTPLLFGFVSFLAAMNAADTSDVDPWLAAIEAAPDVVERGYKKTAFPYNGTRWREVLRCEASPVMQFDQERTCLVCSIDDVGGQKYGRDTAPPTAVSIGLAYAHFARDAAFVWRLDRYEPIGSNHRATNNEFRHRASTQWIRDEAVKECEDLHELVGTAFF